MLGRFWTDPQTDTRQDAFDCATKALSLIRHCRSIADPWCQVMMGFVLAHLGRRDEGGPYFDRAVALHPGDVQIAYFRAWWLARMGRAKEALDSLDRATHRDPFPPAWMWEVRGSALFAARRYEDVIHAFARMSHPHVWNHAYIAACHAHLGRGAEARAAASEVLRVDPRFTVRRYALVEEYTLPAELKHLLDGLRKAGLPE